MSETTRGEAEREGPKPPRTINELLEFDNVPARAQTPANVTENLATRRLYLSGEGTNVASVRRMLRAGDTEYVSLSLRGSMGLGLPGRNFHSISASDLASSSEMMRD